MSILYKESNEEGAMELFEKKEFYDIDTFSSHPNLMDFEFAERILYGRVDQFYQAIVPKDYILELKRIPSDSNTAQTTYALNFVVDVFEKLKYNILIFNEILKNIIINHNNMLKLCDKGYITSTDLADYIVRELGYSFRKSYDITAKIVNYCERNNKSLKELKMKELNKIEPKLNEDVLKVFDLNYSIKSKRSFGGTSFENIKKMIKLYKKEKLWK